MLGFGWYEWDKQCPSGKRCVPPLYGNFRTTKIKTPANTPRRNGDQADRAMSPSWKAGIPRGNDACIKVDSAGDKASAASMKKLPPIKPNHVSPRHRRRQPNEITNSTTNCLCDPFSYSVSLHTTKSMSDVCSGNSSGTKKQLYNVMWDPKIARGTTLVHFEDAQRAKWKRQVESHQSSQARRQQMRRRRMKMKEDEYLDPRSNPTRQLIYPSVTIRKEPLTNSSFDLFLTEQCEIAERTNAGQTTDAVRVGPPHGLNKNSFSFGISTKVQTDSDCNSRQQNVDWIASTLIEKIPQQAVLELQEEAELEAVKDEQRRYELVFLYRKWQEMKEHQWNEYLRSWNELRMDEILDQNAYLRDQQERVLVIAFSKNAISSCFKTTLEGMKQDKFINELGVPYEELREFNDNWNYQDRTENYLAEQQALAKKVVDSALINAVVQRFSSHMFDDFGRPHGVWLYKHGRRDTIVYDLDLQRYLEGRWRKRRDDTVSLNENSLNALYSETSLLSIFDFYKDQGKTIEKKPTLKAGQSEIAILIKNLISKQRLGRRTGKSITLPEIIVAAADNKNERHSEQQRLSNEDHDVSMIYKRNTRWSKLDLNDERQHQDNQQQKNSYALRGGKKGSRLVSDVKRTENGGTKRVTSDSGGADNDGHDYDDDDDDGAGISREREKVDSDKLKEPGDGESEAQRGKLYLSPDAVGDSGRQSVAPRARFE